MQLSERTKFWVGIGFSFIATFFGVVLGFFAANFDRSSVEEENFENLRRVSLDECFETNKRIDLAREKWDTRKEEFRENPLENMDMLNSIPFPIIFFDALEKNLNFTTRLAPESYSLLLSERHDLVNMISTYNNNARRIADMTAFTRLPLVQSHDAKLMAQAMIERDTETLHVAVTDASNRFFFGCFALAVDECRESEEYANFHRVWRDVDSHALVDGSFAVDTCGQMFSNVSYHSN